MGERGQIVIPKKARDIFELHAGSELLVLGDESQGLALQRVEDTVAMLAVYGRAVNERLSERSHRERTCEMQTEFVTMEMENNPAWNAELEGWRPIISEWAEKGASCALVR